ncbi:MAG: hypothetical protein KDB22_04955 [Planctomycetales bacterium]|nr:hypothetical protein [Planctomycetales bacterium]
MHAYLKAGLFVTVLCWSNCNVSAQSDAPQLKVVTEKALINDVDKSEMLHAKFKSLFTGVRLRGQFTIDGKPLNQLKEEAYDISTVEKLPNGDQWLINARMKYGNFDVTVPIALDVKWAGETPVITLDNLTIPGMGTFSARVVLHQNKYAGTWQHDAVGGHLFGTIEQPKTAEEDKAADSDASQEN